MAQVEKKIKPQILFIFPSSKISLTVSTHIHMSLGSAYIISYLLQKGITARQWVADVPLSVSECVKRIVAIKPRVVGFTVYNTNYVTCQLIANGIKAANPGIIILFGGPTPTVQSEHLLKRNPFVDICVRNEAEETCLELITRLDNAHYDIRRTPLETVEGISYRRGSDIISTPPGNVFLKNRKTPDYLDKYPSPYLSGTAGSERLGIITARGCDRHCVYCNCAVATKRIITTHSVDRVIGELDFLSRKTDNKTPIDIFDDAFTLLPQRAAEICDKIIENKLAISLSCATRCDCISEELLDKMKEAGFVTVALALESAVPRILRAIGKIQPPKTKSDPHFEKEKEFVETFKKYASYAKKIGIKTVAASIMIGLPTETVAEGRQTISFIESMGESLDLYTHNICRIYTGTPLYDNYKKQAMDLVTYDNLVHSRTVHPYETAKIPLAPGSNMEEQCKGQDKADTRSLALCLTQAGKSAPTCIHRVVLFQDKVSDSHLTWLRVNLAINGHIIQVYSSVTQAEQEHRQNERRLIQGAPTNYHAAYYQVEIKEGTKLVPFRPDLPLDNCGLPIDLISTGTGITASAGFDPVTTLCIDKNKEDVQQLYDELIRISSPKKKNANIFDIPVYPYIGSLCRWEKGPLNCRTLETVIVDEKNNIKTCWNGAPIGKVGISFSELQQNLQRIRKETVSDRGCVNCSQRAACAGCIYPAPLSAGEYCGMRKKFDTAKPAERFRMCDLFKELG
ncbi:MAG: radical SAM protein [bacterium]|nr:radical SAM protein [bacterium]